MKMTRIFNIYLLTLFAMLTLSACIDEDDYDNSAKGNIEALWQVMDQHYCFFDYKKEVIGVDWDEVHQRFLAQANEKMTKAQLFEVCSNMLAELQDGHVNLYASHDMGRNWSFKEQHPNNYDENLVSDYYLGTDYHIAAGLSYKILDDNIAYVRCESFSEALGDGNISDALYLLALCDGLIIDVRNNPGGKLTTSRKLASHFTNQKTLVGYIYHKTGKGRNDFSKAEEENIEPAEGMRWQKPVVVLANRSTYSAANDFVKCMKVMPNVTIVGDTTGGGSGMPMSSEIPAGWSVRYSAVVMLDQNRQHTEFGVSPDVHIDMDVNDHLNHHDTIIETARKMLRKD